MNKIISILIVFLLPSIIWAQSISITKADGWFETAYIEWQNSANAESYNVYYSGNGVSETKIDDPLIRKYSSNFRADIPGLKAGDYTLKVVPVIGGVEGVAVSTAVTVLAHDRAGFAFSNGRVPGAYKADGTLKDGAVVLYINNNNIDNISMDVTGANSNPCVGLQNILFGFKKGGDNRDLAIRVIGAIDVPSVNDKGDIVVENNLNSQNHITIEGIGEDATANGWGIRLKNAANIEIRNIGIMNVSSSEGDNIGLQQNNEYVWVHNVDFFYGGAGGDSDQAKGDGALDCKKSRYVTFSYNHFWDTGKSNLLGLSEGSSAPGLYITYHHNWYDHSDSRHPRVRYYSAHVYNNYYDGIAKYGVGSTLGSSVFVENNYFRNCKYPILTSMQGSDVWDGSANDYSDMPTFSKEDGGTIKAFGNYIEGAKRFVPYGSSSFSGSTQDFDAVVVSSRDEQIPSSIKSSYGGNTYNNFDTDNSLMYNYTVETPENAKNTVMQYAGRLNGGDFKWTFNNSSDDASYAVNSQLKSALLSYQTSLMAIQSSGSDIVINPNPPSSSSEITPSSSSDITPSSSSDVTPSSSSEVDPGSSSSEVVVDGDIVHNFTTSALTSDYFNIVGNLSTSKGSVNYNGLTLTQCLKMESSTDISFNISDAATLKLVFNEIFTGNVKVNGTNYSAVAGIVEVDLSAGAVTISKADIANLFYIQINFDASAPSSSSEVIVSSSSELIPSSSSESEDEVAPSSSSVDEVILSSSSEDIAAINNKINFVDMTLDNDVLMIKGQLEGVYTIAIYDMVGNKVYANSITNNSKSINLSAINMKSGLYLIRVSNKSQQHVIKYQKK